MGSGSAEGKAAPERRGLKAVRACGAGLKCVTMADLVSQEGAKPRRRAQGKDVASQQQDVWCALGLDEVERVAEAYADRADGPLDAIAGKHLTEHGSWFSTRVRQRFRRIPEASSELHQEGQSTAGKGGNDSAASSSYAGGEEGDSDNDMTPQDLMASVQTMLVRQCLESFPFANPLQPPLGHPSARPPKRSRGRASPLQTPL